VVVERLKTPNVHIRTSAGVHWATDRWPGVARRLVAFFVSPKKVTKERRPRHTRIPEAQARRTGGKELAPPCFFNFVFVGGTQTPLPLIHPPHLIFGGSVRGNLKPGSQ
jgi:hypothetical protein